MEVIIKPLITEKMTAQTDKFNRYGFVVNRMANKIEIKKAIELQYGVSVQDVNTMIYMGKQKVRQTKKGLQQGRTNHFKKAIVTLNSGETIDFFSNI